MDLVGQAMPDSPAVRHSLTYVKTLQKGNRRLRISVLRCRGGTGGRSVEVELDEETYGVHPVAGKRLQIEKCKLQIAN